MKKLTQAAKALVAGASVAITAAIPLVDGGITLKEGLLIAGAFLVGAFPTWLVPNATSQD